MSATDDLLANNQRYAETFSGPLPLPPARGVAVIACMDARLNVYAILGLAEGEAHVIRNAGGVVTDDEIRSLAISQRLLGTREIILIHHTDCGMLDVHRRRLQGSHPGRHRHQAAVGGRGLRRPGHGRPPVDRADQGQPVRPAHRRGARVRVRRRDRQAERGRTVLLTRARITAVGVVARPCCSARNRSNWAPSSSAVGMFSGSSASMPPSLPAANASYCCSRAWTTSETSSEPSTCLAISRSVRCAASRSASRGQGQAGRALHRLEQRHRCRRVGGLGRGSAARAPRTRSPRARPRPSAARAARPRCPAPAAGRPAAGNPRRVRPGSRAR